MKKIMLLVLACTFLSILAETGFACSCLPPNDLAHEVESSAAVFSGKVIDVKKHDRSVTPFWQVEVIFEVNKSWKGADKKIVSIFTSSGSASCGYNFKTGRSYLVYASGNADGLLNTTICNRTKRLSKAREDIKMLEKISQ